MVVRHLGKQDPMTSHLHASDSSTHLAPWVESAPATASAAAGTDATGTVMVALGADGRVTDIRIDADWPRHLTPRSLGEAVREAVRETALLHRSLWSDAAAVPRPPLSLCSHIGQSPDRAATVQLSAGGDVAEIGYDPGWLAHAPAATIGDRTLAAFQAAYEASDRDRVTTLTARL
jgi:DNA-binding protein YbaB